MPYDEKDRAINELKIALTMERLRLLEAQIMLLKNDLSILQKENEEINKCDNSEVI